MEHLYKDYLTICAIIKDEARYIEEWIVFHRLVGVERFYIYDNNSSDHVKDLLKPYIQKGIVVYQEWPKHPGQVEAYNHFLENFGAASTWVAFIDVDEFLFGTKEDDLRNILNGYKDYSGVCVNWVCFGSSGHIKKPEGLVIENFTTRPSLDFNDNRHVKCIVQPQKVLRALSPHIFVFLDVNSPVTEEGSRIKPSPENLEGALSEKCSIGIMRINHYIIKSKEECEVKLKRTRATMISNDRGKDYFLHFDKNSQKDEEILRFLPQLKKNLETKRDYLAICAIVKNEALYIEEWIEFHRLVGVERFYIYDNNSSDHGKDLLKPYIQKGIVVYQEWPKQRGQVEAYNHFLENFGGINLGCVY